MITVLFFARLREQLNCARLQLDFTGDVATLKQTLIAQRGSTWQALSADNILCAVNQTLANESTPIADNDEVAFYPPVTGG